MTINKYINYYLTFFGYDITYELDAELEDIIIKDGEDISFNQLSGGEKRSVEISLVFALYEIVKLKMPDNINIIVVIIVAFTTSSKEERFQEVREAIR